MRIKRSILLIILSVISFLGLAQQPEDKINKETLTYKDTLQLDFYSIEKFQSSVQPLLILVHGGGFASGKRDGKNEIEFSRKMAKKGYAVASIGYRLTRKNDVFNCDCATEKKINSFVDGAEDLADAIVFLSAQTSLQFNRNKIVLIGSSAGAEIVLHLAFMHDDYRFKHLAPISIAGVISFSGAMIDASYINETNAVPSLFIHGKKDKLVPYETAAHHFCSTDKDGYLMLDGPVTITDRLKKLKTSYFLAYDPEGGHEWANKAYQETDLVQKFIHDIILENKVSNSSFERKTVKLH